jgi:Na+/H+ antiporter NhaD/arsenite permease-like protein
MDMLLSILIFIIVYIFIAVEKIESTIVVIVGAFLTLALHLISFEQAIASIDFNVIFLLVGMMVAVYTISQTGFFEWVATLLAKRAKGNPLFITLFFLAATAFLSAFLDNVTTIILLAPVSILIMQLLEISPVPILILEAIVSNIGGTATLIGDPPNIVVGSKAGLTFNDFLIHAAPAVLLILIVFLGTVYLMLRKQWNIPEEIKTRVTQSTPSLAIIDQKKMITALAILGVILLGFFTQSVTHLETGIVALVGSMIMLAVCRVKVEKSFLHVEWNVIFFFIGLFIIVSALEHNGVIELLAKFLLQLAGSNVLLLCVIILAGSAVISAILNNIPFIITMVPMVQKIIATLSAEKGLTDPEMITRHIAHPLWWSLVLGVCLGGNGTLIGASANVVAAKIGEKNAYRISFMHFTKYGFPFMAQSVVISILYIWIRYF